MESLKPHQHMQAKVCAQHSEHGKALAPPFVIEH